MKIFRKISKLLLISFLAILLAGPAFAVSDKVVLVGGGNATKPLDDFMLDAEVAGAGDLWYVDSNASAGASGDGESWDFAVLTTDEAINLAAANNGDVIHIAAGHAESFTAANGFDADVAGIRIIGYGTGTDMPEFTYADTDATVAVGAANVTFYNLRFLAGISAVVVGIDVEAAGKNFNMFNCEFPEPTTSTFEFVRAIMLDTAADNPKIKGCSYINADATGATNFIDIDTGIVNGVQIIDNYVYGEFAEGAIHTDKVCLEMLIKDNTIVNMTSGQHGIEIAANATGTISNNLVSTDAIGTSYDIGHLNELLPNYWDDYDVYDTSPIPWTTNEDGVNRWSATELAQIEGEVEDGLQAKELDHLCQLTDGAGAKYPLTAVEDSIICKILGDDDPAVCTSYDNSTDSLEAISNALSAGTGSSTALSSVHLDHLVALDGATQIYPEQAVSDSIICKILGDDDPASCATYDNTTDSLEAIGTQVGDTNQEARCVAARVTDLLDHVAKTADGGTHNYPDSVVNDTIFAYIMSDDDPAAISSYDNATDSLEALSVALALGTGATTALDADHLDHLMNTDGATNVYPEQAQEDSTICKMLGDDDPAVCTTYNNATDSLEALGIKTEQIAGADGVAAFPAAAQAANDVSIAEVLRYVQEAQLPRMETFACPMDAGFDSDVLFTVTGNVMVRLVGVVENAVTSTASTCTLSIGTTEDDDGIIAATTVDNAQLVATDVWVDATPANDVEIMGTTTWHIIGGGADINVLRAGNDDILVGGDVDFYCWWVPLSADGDVTAGP